MSERDGSTGAVSYRASTAARWLPRSLAGAVLTSALLVSRDLGPTVARIGLPLLAPAVAVLGGVLALWIVRNGAEVRLRIDVDHSGVEWIDRNVRARMAYDQIDSIAWASPLSVGRRLIPGLLLTDPEGRVYRIPAVIQGGTDLVERVVRNSGRSDLASWAEALGLAARMGRARFVVAVGYGAVGVVLVAGLLFVLR